MDELKVLVDRARGGDLDAFGTIVGRFQDMALAYAYSVLGDFHLAEDAAQEAFVQAYRDLAALREPDAFPGWFRRIVFKHCDRIKRGRKLQTVPLESVVEVASGEPGPAAVVEQREMRDAVLRAISSLPDNERTAVTLFYINGYTQKDIAEFLEVPVTTVNNRLHTSRNRLKERMIRMVNDELKGHGLPKDFPERVRMLLERPRPLTIESHPVKELWDAFRSCFPDFEEVELDEIIRRDMPTANEEAVRAVSYPIDGTSMLRFDLTTQVVDYWLRSGGGPRRLVTVGRVFRLTQAETETKLAVHHKAEVFLAEEGLDMLRLDEIIHGVAARIIPGVEFRTNPPTDDPLMHDYDALWRGRWTEVACGILANEERLVEGGLDPARFGATSFAFGLERCALAKYDIDDARALWRPPYVPAGGS